MKSIQEQITFPFVYRIKLYEIGYPKLIVAERKDLRDYYTSNHKLGDESEMILCG